MKPLSLSSNPQFILMIGDEGSFFVPCKVPGAGAPFFIAPGDDLARKSVLGTLARSPRVPLTLFADTLAQDFRREAVPRLNFLDRPKLIARRLKQAFPQAGMAASLNLKNRGEVLLAGMHGENPVFEWLDYLRAHRRDIIPPITLLPVECAGMVAPLLSEASGGWAMLLSRQRSGGFRQIVTHEGELIFTRLTPPVPLTANPRELTETVARDIRASLGYLGRLGLTDPAQLVAVLLMPKNAHEFLRERVLPVQARLMTPREAAWELDLPFLPEADEIYADFLYAGWLAQKPKPRLPMMPPEIKQARQEIAVRQWGWRAAAAVLVLAFGVTAWQGGDLLTTLFAARQETATLAWLKQKLTTEQTAAAPMTEPLGRLRQAVERRRLFSEPVVLPWAMLTGLGQGIGTDARLVKLDWQSDKPADETIQVDVELIGGKSSSPVDKRVVAARFQSLAQNVVQAMPGYDVKLARYPFPALPQEALSNENMTKKDPTEDETAELVVKRVGQ